VRFREDVRNDSKILALAKWKGNDLCEHKRMTHFEWLNGFMEETLVVVVVVVVRM
jgi:hypothetical protein